MSELDLYIIERKTSSPLSKINWKPGQKELIAKLYIEDKLGYRQIGKKFNEKLHYNTIKRIVESYGGEIRTVQESREQTGLFSTAFQEIDTKEKAYWLGFLSADGAIYKGYVKLALQIKDYTHIEKFKTFLNSSAKITTYSCKKHEYCSISIGNKKLYNDLVALGCCEKKSLVLKPYTLIPDEYVFDYIRGYWDGDGGISFSEKNNRWQAYCTSTKEMLDFFVEKMELKTKPFLEHNCKQTYRIHFNGKINVYKKMSLLYNNATIYLDRKKELFEKLKKSMLQ